MMTPIQHHFPHFLNTAVLDAALSPLGMFCYRFCNKKSKNFDSLAIADLGTKTIIAKIPFDSTIMVQNGKVIYWQTQTDSISLYQLDSSGLISQTIELSNVSIGDNFHETHIEVKNLVTYARIEKIKYDQSFYDQYAILLVNKNSIKIIPFHEFNLKGGDYGYVWPALARLDENGILYGKGTRMDDFKLKITL